MKIYHHNNWQYWYDMSYRCWFAAQFDKEGNQVGEVIDAYTKIEIQYIIGAK